MKQEKSPDGIIKRLVDYASNLSTPKELGLMDDAVGVINHLIRRAQELDGKVINLNKIVSAKDTTINGMIAEKNALLLKQQRAVEILQGVTK